jgi:hypothetical protein
MYDFKSAQHSEAFRFRISRISTVSNSLAQRVFGSRASASFCPSARVRSAVRNKRLWFKDLPVTGRSYYFGGQ